MKNSERWRLFEQLLFVPKHVTLSQKMRLAFPVSIPASCFFDRQAICDRNSKGGIRGFPNWDWKISKQSLSISEHCKKTAHDTKWPCLFELFRSFLHFWPWWHQVTYFHARRGRYVNSQLVPSEKSPLAYTSPKLKVSTPCPKMWSYKLKSIVWVHMKYVFLSPLEITTTICMSLGPLKSCILYGSCSPNCPYHPALCSTRVLGSSKTRQKQFVAGLFVVRNETPLQNVHGFFSLQIQNFWESLQEPSTAFCSACHGTGPDHIAWSFHFVVTRAGVGHSSCRDGGLDRPIEKLQTGDPGAPRQCIPNIDEDKELYDWRISMWLSLWTFAATKQW